LNGLSDLPTLRRVSAESGEEPEPRPVPGPQETPRRRIGADTINDLLFWGVHLCVVAVSLAIVWYKIDHLSGGIRMLLDSQVQELSLVRRQVASVEEQTALTKAGEEQRSEQVKRNRQALDLMLTSMTDIQASIRKNLEETQGISAHFLEVAEQSKQASLLAANASQSAVNASKSAENAAAAAAARSSATKTLIREKVVTTDDKMKIKEQEQALAAKKAQLQKTIKRVQKNGPNIIQRIFQ
jgi:hypothetical protein